MSYFAMLKPRLEPGSKSILWLLFACKKSVDLSCSSSSLNSFSKCTSSYLRRWFGVEKKWLGLFSLWSQSPGSSISPIFCSLWLTQQQHQQMTQPNPLDWNCVERLVLKKSWMIFIQKLERGCRSKLKCRICGLCLFAHNWFVFKYCQVPKEVLTDCIKNLVRF